MNSPTHDAIGLGTAYVLFAPSTANATGLLVGSLCIATHGLLEQRASIRHRAAMRRHEELAAVGFAPEFQPRWRGPRRKLTRLLRVVAIIGAGTVALPIGVALATSRLPDQLEFRNHYERVRKGRREQLAHALKRELGRDPTPDELAKRFRRERVWINRRTIRHREQTHWLITAIVLLGLVAYGLHALVPIVYEQHVPGWHLRRIFDAQALTLAVVLGVGTHLVLDGWTKDGVPYLAPFVRRDWHLSPRCLWVRAGSLVDTAIMLTALGLTVWLTTVRHVGLLEG